MRRVCVATVLALAMVSSGLVGGCISVKTEHEIKPIQITMDINLKVQKEIEDFWDLD